MRRRIPLEPNPAVLQHQDAAHPLLGNEAVEVARPRASGGEGGERATAIERVYAWPRLYRARQEERIQRGDVLLALRRGPRQDGGGLRSRFARRRRLLRPGGGDRRDEDQGEAHHFSKRTRMRYSR